MTHLPTHLPMHLPNNEPKNGDFVAYLAAIEKNQLAALEATSVTSSASNRVHTESTIAELPDVRGTVAQPFTSSQGTRTLSINTYAGVGLSILGLIFIGNGLFGNGGLLLVLLGVWLGWQGLRMIYRNHEQSFVQRLFTNQTLSGQPETKAAATQLIQQILKNKQKQS